MKKRILCSKLHVVECTYILSIGNPFIIVDRHDGYLLRENAARQSFRIQHTAGPPTAIGRPLTALFLKKIDSQSRLTPRTSLLAFSLELLPQQLEGAPADAGLRMQWS